MKIERSNFMNQYFYSKIEEVIISANECIKAFRSGNDALGYRKIIEFIEKIQMIFEDLEKDKNVSNEVIINFINDINSILSQVNETLVTKDTVLTADLLEFELVPLIGSLKDLYSYVEGDLNDHI